jgi:hypothetical protein
MEKFQIARKEALSKIKAADHMLTQTYPALNENKILFSVLTNLIAGVEQTMTAILHYDRTFSKIPPFHDTFASKLNLFRNTSAGMHKLNEFVPFLAKMNEYLENHKNSPVEFARKESFVIADDNYNLRTITAKDLKKFLDDAKSFYMKAAEITAENEEIFNLEKED